MEIIKLYICIPASNCSLGVSKNCVATKNFTDTYTYKVNLGFLKCLFYNLDSSDEIKAISDKPLWTPRPWIVRVGLFLNICIKDRKRNEKGKKTKGKGREERERGTKEEVLITIQPNYRCLDNKKFETLHGYCWIEAICLF